MNTVASRASSSSEQIRSLQATDIPVQKRAFGVMSKDTEISTTSRQPQQSNRELDQKRLKIAPLKRSVVR
jgi:hypothetical protein